LRALCPQRPKEGALERPKHLLQNVVHIHQMSPVNVGVSATTILHVLQLAFVRSIS
jgi:hypothetical protein